MRDYKNLTDDYGMAILDAVDNNPRIKKKGSAGGGKSIITKAIKQVKRTLVLKAEKEDLRSGMVSGADDYIIKPFTFSELFNSIQKRIERLSQIRNNSQLSNALEGSISLSTEEEHKALSQIVNLSKTENKIMKKIALGMTSLQISQELNISIRTAENHRHNICKKLNLKGSNSLIKFALKFKSVL
jgi:FixJ family two-component response regulator